MSASATQTAGGVSHGSSMAIKPPSHPTYDLKAVIKLALAEDAGDTGSLFRLLSIKSFHLYLSFVKLSS